jgi:hypothetical protein
MSVSVTLLLSTIAKLARNQFNDLKAPGTSKCSAKQTFLTVETYKKYYLLILMGSEY